MRCIANCFVLLALILTSSVALAQAVNITHGPMLGHVTSESISIWARTSKPGQFHVRYGGMPDRLDQLSESTTTTADRDNTGWVRLKGLSPNTRYYYRPVTSSNSGPARSFLTLPYSESYRDAATNPRGLFNFRFQFGSCADQRPVGGTGPGLPAYGTMLKQLPGSILFSIMNGDWLHEDKREFTVDQWREQTGSQNILLPKILELAPSIAGVWENYKYFLERGANLAAWHRVVPSYYTPDDHEILNDIFGTATVGRHDRRTVFRDIGIQAWFDYLAGSQPLPFPHRDFLAGQNSPSDRMSLSIPAPISPRSISSRFPTYTCIGAANTRELIPGGFLRVRAIPMQVCTKCSRPQG